MDDTVREVNSIQLCLYFFYPDIYKQYSSMEGASRQLPAGVAIGCICIISPISAGGINPTSVPFQQVRAQGLHLLAFSSIWPDLESG